MPKIIELMFEASAGKYRVPEFQRGWVWAPKQVLQLFTSLYRDYPVGSLIVWPTTHGEQNAIENIIDGQQRLTVLYSFIQGTKPPWFRGELPNALKGLMFNIGTEEFKYHTQAMDGNPLWVDVSELFDKGHQLLDEEHGRVKELRALGYDANSASYHANVSKFIRIRDRPLHVDKLPDKISPEDAAKVFKIVNRAGTRVREGDLVLGQLCMRWPEAKSQIAETIAYWESSGYRVSLEWILHAMAALLGERINFDVLLDASADDVVEAFEQVRGETSNLLNRLRDDLGLDSTTTTPINNGLIVAVFERARRVDGVSGETKLDRALVGWWLLSTLHNRWSHDVRNRTNADLSILVAGQGIPGLLRELRKMVRPRDLELSAANFDVHGVSSPYFRLLRCLTRRRGARDLRTGVSLSFEHIGEHSQLDKHHIFPRQYLLKAQLEKSQIDQIANIALIRHDTNSKIRAKSPDAYLGKYENDNPGVLASQWIPNKPALWTSSAYSRFLEERRDLLAKESNKLLRELMGEAL